MSSKENKGKQFKKGMILMEDTKKYLEPTFTIDSDNLQILELSHRLTKNVSLPAEKISSIFYYVRDNCHYNMYCTSENLENYKASNILARGIGYCVQKAILFAALGRAANIPSRLVLVAIRNHKTPPEVIELMKTDIFFPHAYNQFFIENKWVSAAATFDKTICDKINVKAVEFDGKQDAVLPSYDLSGQPYIEYVEHFGYFHDLPFTWILENLPRYYGSDYHIWFDNK